MKAIDRLRTDKQCSLNVCIRASNKIVKYDTDQAAGTICMYIRN